MVFETQPEKTKSEDEKLQKFIGAKNGLPSQEMEEDKQAGENDELGS